MKIVFALLAAFAISMMIWACDAHAAQSDYTPLVQGRYAFVATNIGPLHTTRTDQVVTLAHNWWATYGQTSHEDTGESCATFNIFQGDEPSEINAEAPEPGCYVVISRTLLNTVRPTIKDSWLLYSNLIDFCFIVTHEVGHSTGLEHTAHGVMQPSGIDSKAIPPFCQGWVQGQLGAARRRALKASLHVRSDRALFRAIIA